MKFASSFALSQARERVFAAITDPEVLRRAIPGCEELTRIGEDRYEVASPQLLRAAAEVMERGVTLGEALAVVEQVRRHCEGVARSFVKLYLDAVWKPLSDLMSRPGFWGFFLMILLYKFGDAFALSLYSAFSTDLSRSASWRSALSRR